MSEDGDPAAPEPGPPDPAPELAAPDPAPELVAIDPTRQRRHRRRRLVILGAVAAVVVTFAIVIGLRNRGRVDAPRAPGARGDGGAAIRAPEGPRIPGEPTSGVHLTGFVVDGAGLAVAGAEVTAELERGAPDRALQGSAAAPTIIMTNDAGVPAAPVVSAALPSGPDGRFTIEGLAPGRYRVRVAGPGLLAAEVRFVPVPSDAARLVVARQVAIEGVVLDGGKPVPNAQVGLRGDAIGGTIELRADASGAFAFKDLPEGRYQLWAWQAALAARTLRVNRLGAGPFGPVALTLEAAAIIAGRVIDRDEGTGLVAAIELRPVGDDQAPRYTRSAEDGTFRIEGVPNGTWIADAFTPGYTSPGGVELVAGKSIPELALVKGAMVEGRVLDGDGQPVADATVRALGGGANPAEVSLEIDRDKLRRFSGRTAAPTPVSPTFAGDPQLIARGELGVMVGPIPPLPPPGSEIARTATVVDVVGGGLVGEPPPLPIDPARASIWTTAADGRFRIRGLAKGKVSVLAVAVGYAEGRSKTVTVEGAQVVVGVEVVLTPGTFLVGKVTDQHGTPVVGAQLTARGGADAIGGNELTGFAELDGSYRLGPFTGTVELRAVAYGHGEARRSLELPPARGKLPDEHREDLVLALADAMLAGTLDDTTGAPVSGAHIEVISGGLEGRHAIVGTDGTFAIDMLPAGPLRVRIVHPDYPPDEVAAVASEGGKARVRLRLPLGGAVEGALLDANGAPLPSVTIVASGPANGLAEATSDTAGRWKLGPVKPGTWRLVVKLPGYLPLTRELDVPASRAPGQTSMFDIRLDLARGAVLGGTVRDDRGQRVAGAHVVARAASGAGVIVEGDADSQGEFRLRDCPTGELELVASKGDLRGVTRATVRPGDEILGLAIEVR